VGEQVQYTSAAGLKPNTTVPHKNENGKLDLALWF
jgi:hypothetical protein